MCELSHTRRRCMLLNGASSVPGGLQWQTKLKYVAGLAEELVAMCRQADLADLAFLLEVVSSEAAKTARPHDRIKPAFRPSADNGHNRPVAIAAI